MNDILFSVFPNENFVDIDYISMAGSTALRHIHSALLRATIIFFIMLSPVQEL